MATPILRGNSDVQLQKEVWSWDSTKGGDYSQFWNALDPAKAQSFYNNRVYTCRSAQMTVTNGTAELELKWGAAGVSSGGPGAANSIEVTIDRWECPEPIVQKPVFEHPNFILAAYAFAAYLSATWDDVFFCAMVNAWRKGASANQQFSQFIDGLQLDTSDGHHTLNWSGWQTFVTSYPNQAGTLIRLYRMMANDQTHYQASLYSLRHTTNAPNYWSLNRADLDVNCIYTPAQFITEVTDGTLWYLPLPGRLQFKLAAAISTLLATTPVRANYQIGWLKGASAESSIQGGRVEIQTEYKLDQWSTDLYNLAT